MPASPTPTSVDDSPDNPSDDVDPPPALLSGLIPDALNLIPQPLVAAACAAAASSSAAQPSDFSFPLPPDDLHDVAADLDLSSPDLELFLRDTQYYQLPDPATPHSSQHPSHSPTPASNPQRPLSPPYDPLQQNPTPSSPPPHSSAPSSSHQTPLPPSSLPTFSSSPPSSQPLSSQPLSQPLSQPAPQPRRSRPSTSRPSTSRRPRSRPVPLKSAPLKIAPRAQPPKPEPAPTTLIHPKPLSLKPSRQCPTSLPPSPNQPPVSRAASLSPSVPPSSRSASDTAHPAAHLPLSVSPSNVIPVLHRVYPAQHSVYPSSSRPHSSNLPPSVPVSLPASVKPTPSHSPHHPPVPSSQLPEMPMHVRMQPHPTSHSSIHHPNPHVYPPSIDPSIPQGVIYDPNFVPLFGMHQFAYPHVLPPAVPVTHPILHHPSNAAESINAPVPLPTHLQGNAMAARAPPAQTGAYGELVHTDAFLNEDQTVVVMVDGIQRQLRKQPAARLDRHPVLGRLQLTSDQKALTVSSTKPELGDEEIKSFEKEMHVEPDKKEADATMTEVHDDDVNDVAASGTVDMDDNSAITFQIVGKQANDVEGARQNRRNLVQKKRLVWTPELHTKFVKAIEQVGINQAVPKTLVMIMNVEGLTTEHVKSHLQKYRNSLKKEAEEEAKSTEGSIKLGMRKDKIGGECIDGNKAESDKTEGGRQGGENEDSGDGEKENIGEEFVEIERGLKESKKVDNGDDVEKDGKGGVTPGTGRRDKENERDLELELYKEKTLHLQLQLQMMAHRTIAIERKLQQEYEKHQEDKKGEDCMGTGSNVTESGTAREPWAGTEHKVEAEAERTTKGEAEAESGPKSEPTAKGEGEKTGTWKGGRSESEDGGKRKQEEDRADDVGWKGKKRRKDGEEKEMRFRTEVSELRKEQEEIQKHLNATREVLSRHAGEADRGASRAVSLGEAAEGVGASKAGVPGVPGVRTR